METDMLRELLHDNKHRSDTSDDANSSDSSFTYSTWLLQGIYGTEKLEPCIIHMNFIPALAVNEVIAGTKVTVVSEQLTNGKSNKLCTKYCHIIQEISCQLCPREHG
jgi:hypothetical protein